MAVTEYDVTRIPGGNLRVSRSEFAAVWAAAEHRDASGVDWYAGGVVDTCRWLAGRSVRRPATGRTGIAYEERIEDESVAAESLAVRRPDLVGLQPGWCEGVRATLRWAWRRDGGPPVSAVGGPSE
ncbi:hypothetical protein [Pseudonocardia humida]|uniref:Uncharacterized protein n=1 Tax=Pseudonocardia humida TaxID=2800819 RepID=A0ABT1A4H9_9PSEU|nr:hypothetical protein [Pseudonocardia humida]MCO1657875.1 hypothetical protein [Pseudonocardia humida]